jgi:hypothetical protein
MKQESIPTADSLPDPMQAIVPEQFRRTMGLVDGDIAHALLRNPSLEGLLADKIRTKIDPKVQNAEPLHDIYTEIVLRQQSGLESILKPIALVLNRRALLDTTDGSTISQVLEWAATPDLESKLREDRGFEFEAVQLVPSFSVDLLKLYVRALQPFLLGVLPEPYFARFMLRHDANTEIQRACICTTSKDHKVLTSALNIVAPLLFQKGDRREKD